MRYLLVLLLAVTPLLGADIVVKDTTITRGNIDACKALVLGFTDLEDEPANAAIVAALEAADKKSYIRFTKAVYDDSCADQPTCHTRTTQACGLLGGVLGDDGAEVVVGGVRQRCEARCVVSDDLSFAIRFACGG